MVPAARLVAATIAAAVMAAIAAINSGYLQDATVKLRWDSIIVAREIELVNGTCPEVKAGPLGSVECVRQFGLYYVAYLPPGYIVHVREGWVIGLYDRIG